MEDHWKNKTQTNFKQKTPSSKPSHTHISYIYSLPLQITSEKCFLDRWCFPCLDSSSNLLFGETKFSTELHIIHQQRINRLNIACSQVAAVLQCSMFRSPLRTAHAGNAASPHLGSPLDKSLPPHHSVPSPSELNGSTLLLKLQK